MMKFFSIVGKALCAFFLLFAACGTIIAEAVQAPWMQKIPVIDGKFDAAEWQDALVWKRSISGKNKLLALRNTLFYFGCDGKNLYLAQQSELKPSYIQAEEKRCWEITLLPPGGKQVSFAIEPGKSGKLPAGAVVKYGTAKGFWHVELAIPLSSFNGKDLANGVWGVQMVRKWNIPGEKAMWHLPTAKEPLAQIRIVPKGVLCNLVDMINHTKLASWRLTWQIKNTLDKPVTLRWTADVKSLEAPVNRAKNITLAPGASEEVVMQSIFMPGTYRTFTAEVKNAADNTVYWQRKFSWNFAQAKKWFDPDPPLQLHYAVHPTAQTLRVRVFCRNAKKFANVAKAEVLVTHESGKVVARKALTKRANKDWFSYWNEPEMKNWPLGKYTLTVKATGKDGKNQELKGSFGRHKFEWENNKLGKSEQYIPPFKPLKVKNNEIHALLTGYRRSGVFWDAVYAQDKNILAAPIELKINGETFKSITTRQVKAPFGHVIFETDFIYKDLKLTAVHDYDYDGMCKVTLKFTPVKPVKIDSMYFDIDLKKEYVTLYSAMGARLRNNFHGWVPEKEGLVWDSLRGRVLNPLLKGFRPYIWVGEQYKGFCWFAETPHNWSIDPSKPAQTLMVEKSAVRVRINLVNKPVTRDKKFDIVMGFQPTPVKPQPKVAAMPGLVHRVKFVPRSKYRNIIASYIYMCMRYEDGMLSVPPNNDWSFLEYVAADKWKTPAEAQAFALDYVKRNKLDQSEYRSIYDYSPALSKNLHLSMRAFCEVYRPSNVRIQYQNPRAVAPNSKEFDMYSDEWSLWETRPPSLERMSHFGCDPTDKLTDFMLYNLRKLYKYGFTGIYYDNIFDTPCYNVAKGPAIEVEPGKIMPYYPLFEMRELLKRSALFLHEEGRYLGGYPLLESHITDTVMIPLVSFNAVTLDWEMNFGSDPYPRRFSQPYILTNTVGTQTGTLGATIIQRDKTVPGDVIERSVLAVQFANNLMSGKLYATPGMFYQNAINYIFDFGYEAEGTVIYPGYLKNNPVKINNKDVLATVVKRKDGEVLLMIGNVGKKAVKATFDLGKFASGTIYDAESKTIIGKGNRFTLPVEKYSYRLIQVGKAPANAQKLSGVANWNKATRAVLEHTAESLIIKDIKKDHYIVNNTLQLDTNKINTITIEYRARGIAGKTNGQLYFAKDKQKFGSPLFFRLPSLKSDDVYRTITIKTAKNPEWKKLGKVTAIRLDMMDQAPGVIEIKDIKFQ